MEQNTNSKSQNKNNLNMYKQDSKNNKNLNDQNKSHSQLVNYITSSQLMQILKQRAVLVHSKKE